MPEPPVPGSPVFEPPAPGAPLRARLARTRTVLGFALRRAAALRLPQVAGSLTFTTVLGVVPLLAVALAVFSAFPLFGEFRSQLEANLLRNLLPDAYSTLLLRYLNEFASKAARVGAAGVAGLVLTALLLILTVDRVLNDIWAVVQRRGLTQRILVYWALLTLGPVLVGASLTLTSWLGSVSAGVVRGVPPVLHQLLDGVPFVLSVFGWSALYVYVPNRQVAWRDALVGGLSAAVTGELLSRGFATYITKGGVMSIYGAFAAVPVFLLWIYLSWLAILLGASIAATLPMLRNARIDDHGRPGDPFVTAAALVLALAARRRRDPPGATSARALAWEVRTFEEDVVALLRQLETLGYVRQLAARGPQRSDWLLVVDPEVATLQPVFARLGVDPENRLLARDPAGLGRWLGEGLASDWMRRPIAQIATATPVPVGGAPAA